MEPSIVAAAQSHADVMCDLVCDMARGSNAHQPQVLLYLLVVHDFQEGRLFELYGKPLPQRAIKHGVAGRVREVGEDDGVLVRQRVRLPGEKQPAAHGQPDNHNGCGSDRPPSSGLPGGFRQGLSRCDGCLARFCVSLQPLQIRADVDGALVAQLLVLFQCLVDDFF